MWSAYLTRLANQYAGKAGLILHDFEMQTGEVLDTSDNVSKELLIIYRNLARNHPWAPYMWSSVIGTPIFPDERRVTERIARDKNLDEFIEVLTHYKIGIGMGAVLWKNRHPNPRYVISIGVLRDGDPYKGDVFDKEEKESFVEWLPVLTKDIQGHVCIKRLLSEH